jgi:very-short-patch-repair endonuclease
MSKNITTEDFIKMSIELFTDKYNFDFFIPEFNTCIEYDGRQHFEPIEYFGGFYSLEKQRIKDKIKDNFCKNNNIKLIRIPYYEFDNIEKILNYSL